MLFSSTVECKSALQYTGFQKTKRVKKNNEKKKEKIIKKKEKNTFETMLVTCVTLHVIHKGGNTFSQKYRS